MDIQKLEHSIKAKIALEHGHAHQCDINWLKTDECVYPTGVKGWYGFCEVFIPDHKFNPCVFNLTWDTSGDWRMLKVFSEIGIAELPISKQVLGFLFDVHINNRTVVKGKKAYEILQEVGFVSYVNSYKNNYNISITPKGKTFLQSFIPPDFITVYRAAEKLVNQFDYDFTYKPKTFVNHAQIDKTYEQLDNIAELAHTAISILAHNSVYVGGMWYESKHILNPVLWLLKCRLFDMFDKTRQEYEKWVNTVGKWWL